MNLYGTPLYAYFEHLGFLMVITTNTAGAVHCFKFLRNSNLDWILSEVQCHEEIFGYLLLRVLYGREY